MKKLIYILSGLLALQLVLAFTLNLEHHGIQGQSKPKALLALKDGDIDHISISSNDGKTIDLTRTEGKWRLSDQDEFPANQQQVAALLQQILTLKHAGAVADSDNAARRFKVANKTFERKVVLSQQNVDMATLYVGTSASMRETHIRLDGEAQVYLADLPVYRLPVTSKDWMQQDLLQVKTANIQALKIGDITLRRTDVSKSATADKDQAPAAIADNAKVQKMVDKLIDDNGNKQALTQVSGKSSDNSGWQLTPLPVNSRINFGKVNQALQQLASLRISDLLGVEQKPNFGLDKPLLQVSVQRNKGDEVTYRLAQMTDSKDYVLKSSLSQEYFRLPQAQGDAFVAAFKPAAFSEPLVAATPKADTSNPQKPFKVAVIGKAGNAK